MQSVSPLQFRCAFQPQLDGERKTFDGAVSRIALRLAWGDTHYGSV
jgi:hypothetical protein